MILNLFGIIPLIFLAKLTDNYFSVNTSLNGFYMSLAIVIPVALFSGLIYKGLIKIPAASKGN
jgi:hypothetical protein